MQGWHSDEVIATGSRDADIRDRGQIRNLFARCRPDWTILAAAYTDVDGCERNPELAHQVNCVGAGNIALAAREHQSRLMLISTDYVFDGTKSAPYESDDSTGPVNSYGVSKAAAEATVRGILPDTCILRTSWLFGPSGVCFPNTILNAAAHKKQLRVVADQCGCPTFNRDLAEAIVKLVQADAVGTIHATNQGECTWFDFAQEITRVANYQDVTIAPIETKDLQRPARRPRYSVLSNSTLRKYGLSLRPWRQTVPDYIQERSARDPRAEIVSNLQ